jgi:ribonuclease HII
LAKRLESRKNERRKPSRRKKRDVLGAAYRTLEAFDEGFLGHGGEAIAGVDEAGRGALAGPVVAAAVILPRNAGLVGLNDSKKLKEDEREMFFSRIVDLAVGVGVAVGHSSLIDRENILNATLITMARAVGNLRVRPDLILIDGRDGIEGVGNAAPIIGGDAKSLSIAAASVVAKVTRDRLMRRLHRKHPQYNFLSNKGYGTKEHLEAIDQHGLIPEHRRSYHMKVFDKNLDLF